MRRLALFWLALLLAAAALSPSLAWSDDDYARPPTPTPGTATVPDATRSGNDFRWKVLFKADVGYLFDDAAVSDGSFGRSLALQRPGAPGAVDGQAAALNARADYLSSDHVLGTEGLGWSHLRLYYNGFVLHRFEGYAGDPSPTFPTAYLRGRDQTTYDVRAGYGEIDGFKQEGFWSKVYFRAGRQWRYGAGIATFDGVTVGYASADAELAVWGGRRSPRFGAGTDPGYVAGVDGKLHFEQWLRVPVDVGASYLLYAAPGSGVHHLFVVDGSWRPRSGSRLLVSLSSFNLAGLRAYVGFTQAIGREAQLKVYYDAKAGRDVTYDYISGFGLAATRYFTLPDVEPRSRFGVRWDQSLGRRFEYALFADFNIVTGSGDVAGARGWTGATAFDATYEQLGAIARISGVVVQPEAEYRIRLVQRAAESGAFTSTSGAGEHQFQEARFDLRVRPATGLSMLLGAVYRVYDFVTRYAPAGANTTVSNDYTIAGEASVEQWIKRVFLLSARYEVGQDSSVFAPELGVVQRIFVSTGGRF